VINSISGSLMNITPLIHLRAVSMLGFSCSNEKVIVKLCCNVLHVVVPLHNSWSVYQFVGMPSKVCMK
jgi:hypothetical protein